MQGAPEQRRAQHERQTGEKAVQPRGTGPSVERGTQGANSGT